MFQLFSMKTRFNTDEVVAFTGITRRQLQWWDEQKIVVPARLGRNRRYSLDDIAEIAVLQQLRNKGVSLQKLRRIVRFLQTEMQRRLFETVTAESDIHLLTDGKRIYLETSEKQIVDILKNAQQPILAVCLNDAVREIHTEITRKKPVQKANGISREKRRAQRA